MKYTTSKKIDKKIEKYIKIINKIIVQELKPISIILIGGFGRGEGSFYKDEPFNDFDSYIITKNKISSKRLEEVGSLASRAIGKGGFEFMEHSFESYDKEKHFHVDIRGLELNKLGKMMKTTRTFEIKHGSSVIYGKDLRSKIKINEKELPISEGFRHMINKSCHLLLGMDSRRFKGKFNKDEKNMAIYWAVKTILACGETLMLNDGRFAPTYTSRNSLFQKEFKRRYPEVAKKMDFATRFKLKPEFEKVDAIKIWKDARNLLEFTLREISKKHLKVNEKNRAEMIMQVDKKLPKIYFNSYIPLGNLTFPAQYLLNIIYFKRTKYFPSLLSWHDAGLRILAPAFLLLFAIEDKSLLKEVEKYLKYLAPVKDKSFDGLRKSLLYAYGKYFSQKLI